MNSIRAITFDLWDTVFADDTDEPKRKAAGRPSKGEERRQLVYQYISKQKIIAMPTVESVYDAVDTAFDKVWHTLHVTWSVRERLDIILKGLSVTIPETDMIELVRLHEEMELEFMPDFLPGAPDAIKALQGKYRLGVISDTLFSPGATLRKILKSENLLECFDSFIFSDEFGHSKPEQALFRAAAESLDVKPGDLVHIGDREYNDINGSHTSGSSAILCTVYKDRGSDQTEADAILQDYKDLPDIIANLV